MTTINRHHGILSTASARVALAGAVLTLAAAAFFGSGCGGGGTGAQRTTTAPEHVGRNVPVVFLLFDCSGFRRIAPEFEPDLVKVAEDAARHRQKLEFACVDGTPLTTARVLTVDFSRLPGADVNPEVADVDDETFQQVNLARAQSLRPEFHLRIMHGRETVGSGLLEGLVLPAQQANVVRIVFWTDAEVRDPDDGFNLPTATPAEMRAEVRRWIPRLRGLAGRTVVVVGAGRGAQTQATALKAKRLFTALIDRGVHGHLVWTRTLDQLV